MSCLALVVLALVAVLPLAALQWQSLIAAFVFGLPAFWLGVLVWDDWQQVEFPVLGGDVCWRDGLRSGVIPGAKVAAAMMDQNVQPRLHKGPGPTAYIRFWVADTRDKTLPVADPWRRVFGAVVDESAVKAASLHATGDDLCLMLQRALRDLGYPEKYEGKGGGSPQ